MQNQFNKLLLATVIGASLVTTAYGAAEGSATMVLEQRTDATAEQALQGSPSMPLTTDQTLGTVAAASAQATQHINTATRAAGTLQQALTTSLDAADFNTSATGSVALMAASELSGESGNAQQQILAGATSTADTAISGLQGAQTMVVDGANSGRAEIAHYSSVAGQVLQSGQAATTNLSAQTSAAIQSDASRADNIASGVNELSQAALEQTKILEPVLPVDGALPAVPGTSLPTPEVTVNGQAQADISGSAGLNAGTQRMNLNTQQHLQTDVGFSSSGRSSATTASGSSIGGSVGGVTSRGNVLGTGSLLR